MNKYYLVITCPDQIGIQAAVSTFIAERGGLIIDSDNHTDSGQNQFFMRYVVTDDSFTVSLDEFKHQFSQLASQFSMQWFINNASTKKKVLLMVSKESHCLEDVLYRWHSGQFNCEIVGVFSNHADLEKRVSWYDVPYYYEPIVGGDKTTHFARLAVILQELDVDMLVLARYMQVLPAQLCDQYFSKIINIHHGFLPSFSGAHPYKQAYDKGVKLIGATSHFVTARLDEGPIIAQDVMPISHRQSVADLKELGKDIERTVLAKALQACLNDRVIVSNYKTIVFDS